MSTIYIRHTTTGDVHEIDTTYGGASDPAIYAKITKKEFEAVQREKDIAYFRERFPVGARVAVSVAHVSRSGMSRSIKVYAVEEGTVHDVSWRVARLMGDRFDNNNGGVKIGGCGMDMCFALVYNLGRTLYPEGFKVEGRGRNGDTSGWDNDGGYALRHYTL